MVKPHSPLYLTALTVIAIILIHLWLIVQDFQNGKIIYTMASNVSIENLIKEIIESNVDIGSLSGWNPDYMKEKGHKPPDTFLRWQKGDMPTSTLEQLIDYTGGGILGPNYEFKPRIEDARERYKPNLRYEEMDADINILDIIPQRKRLRDLALKQEKNKNIFGEDIEGGTKEDTDNLLFGLLKLQDLINKSLNWTEEDTKNIKSKQKEAWEKYKKKYNIKESDKF